MKTIILVGFLAAMLGGPTDAAPLTFGDPTITTSDYFGYSVAIDGNNVLVGAIFDDTFGMNVGQAHLFDATTGNLLRTFNDPTVTESDNFGISVAIDGNNVLIGAYGDDTNGTNGGQAHLFDATSGNLLRTFNNPTVTTADDRFGRSVGIDGNNVLVGASGDDTLGENVGQAYLFDAATGNLLNTFDDPTITDRDGFGISVAIDGNNVLVGARDDDTNGTNVGQAHLFEATTGNLLKTFNDPTVTTRDEFGMSVAIDGNNVLVGARYDDTNGTDVGQAHLFEATTGSLLKTFNDPTVTVGAKFGRSFALDGNNVLIGAPGVGQAHLFDAISGHLLTTINDPAFTAGDFGHAVALDGISVLVGAFLDDADGTNVGQAHLFSIAELPDPPPTADFNDDGSVDAQDLSTWEAGFGAVDPFGRSLHEFGDADEDSDIDGRDFLAWQREFGYGLTASVSSTNVPEPPALLLALMVFTPLMLLRRLRGQEGASTYRFMQGCFRIVTLPQWPDQRCYLLGMFACRRPAFAVCLFAALVLSAMAPFAPAAEFIPLGNLPGYNGDSLAYGVSDDGMVVSGYSRSGSPMNLIQAFRWTDATGMVGLGYLPGGNFSKAGSAGYQPLSRDGLTIVGQSYLRDTVDGVLWTEAFVHTEAEGMLGLGGTNTIANGVSNDGSVVIGDITHTHIEPNYSSREAFRWTDENGLVGLGFLPGDTDSYVEDISDDGSLIVGYSRSATRDLDGNIENRTDPEVFTWTESTGMVGTGLQSSLRYPLSITNDGSMFSSSSTNDSPEEPPEAFYWTEETGIVGLGWLPGTEGENGEIPPSLVRDMTPDGRLIVGRSGFNYEEVSFVWSEEGGMEDFQQALIYHHGLGEALDGWELRAIESVSSNGQFFTGIGTNPAGDVEEGWLVRLDAPWSFIPDPTADFNTDGSVDELDLSTWEAGFGAVDPFGRSLHEFGDADEDSDIDGGDFLAWQAEYGRYSAAVNSASVPEPTTLLIIVAAVFQLALTKRSKRSADSYRRTRPPA